MKFSTLLTPEFIESLCYNGYLRSNFRLMHKVDYVKNILRSFMQHFLSKNSVSLAAFGMSFSNFKF